MKRVIDVSKTYLISNESPVTKPSGRLLLPSYKTSPIPKCLLFTIPTATITCRLDFASPLTGLPTSTISSYCAARESKNVYYTMWLPRASYGTQQENKLLPLAYKSPTGPVAAYFSDPFHDSLLLSQSSPTTLAIFTFLWHTESFPLCKLLLMALHAWK